MDERENNVIMEGRLFPLLPLHSELSVCQQKEYEIQKDYVAF